MARPTLDEINKLDIVDYLASIDIQPKKISGHQYHYLSPLPGRNETEPSFKVNRVKNRWWDFGTKEGTTLVDFCLKYYGKETLGEVRDLFANGLPTAKYVPPTPSMTQIEAENSLIITETYPIRSYALIKYAAERQVSEGVARRYLIEARYTFNISKGNYYALALKNDAGGFELRNKFHKFSASPKAPTTIRNGSQDVAVVGGMFNMATIAQLLDIPDKNLLDLYVLNTSGFFESSLPFLDSYRNKYLFMDNDSTDNKLVAKALQRDTGYIDMRVLYKGYNDPNKWAVEIGKTPKNGIAPKSDFSPLIQAGLKPTRGISR